MKRQSGRLQIDPQDMDLYRNRIATVNPFVLNRSSESNRRDKRNWNEPAQNRATLVATARRSHPALKERNHLITIISCLYNDKCLWHDE